MVDVENPVHCEREAAQMNLVVRDPREELDET